MQFHEGKVVSGWKKLVRSARLTHSNSAHEPSSCDESQTFGMPHLDLFSSEIHDYLDMILDEFSVHFWLSD